MGFDSRQLLKSKKPHGCKENPIFPSTVRFFRCSTPARNTPIWNNKNPFGSLISTKIVTRIGGGSLPRLDVCPDQFLDVSLFAGNLFQFCDDIRIGVVIEADRHESRVLLLILLVRSVLCF